MEADILLSRPVQSVMCILKGRSVNLEMDCECQINDKYTHEECITLTYLF